MKYVLLTGANGGLGVAVRNELLKNGFFVIGADIVKDEVIINNFVSLKVDLTNDDELNELHKKVKQITPHLDAIINLVGMFKFSSIVEGNENDLRKIFEVNFFAIYKINISAVSSGVLTKTLLICA